MFEDDTIDFACPKCGHLNSVLVRQFEDGPEAHIVCVGCEVGVKIEAAEFQRHLDEVRKELADIERAAGREQKTKRPRKGDFQI
jgi:transcription elongation factor Elf1